MARVSVSEATEIVLEALDANGGEVEYGALSNALTLAGNAHVIPLLRTMKRNGDIAMQLVNNGDATSRLMVGLVAQEEV